jgi:hypothetical protein
MMDGPENVFDTNYHDEVTKVNVNLPQEQRWAFSTPFENEERAIPTPPYQIAPEIGKMEMDFRTCHSYLFSRRRQYQSQLVVRPPTIVAWAALSGVPPDARKANRLRVVRIARLGCRTFLDHDVPL